MENFKKTSLLQWESGKVKGFSGRNLIDLQNGGLKMVKVDPLSAYPSHVHPDKTEFIFVLKGNPVIEIGQEKFTGEKEDFFILPRTVKHSIVNPDDSECLLLVGAIKA